MPLTINGEELVYAADRWDVSRDAKPPRRQKDVYLRDPRTGEILYSGASNPDDMYAGLVEESEAVRIARRIASEPLVIRDGPRPESESW